MKTYLNISISILLLISCDNSLDEVPKNFISTVNFYQNETDAQTAINGAYNSLGKDYYGIQTYLMMELHGDFLNGRGGQGPISFVDQLLDFRGIDYARVSWSNQYAGINRANAVLDNVPNIEDMSDAVKTRILGEAHFLRALAYFDLVRNFGAVPIRLNESKDLTSLDAPRAPESEVYEQIILDATEAERTLPDMVGENTGRASKWAAKMLLAQVHLTLQNWELAAEKANDVILSGVYELVEVENPNDFYKIFATSTSSEDIMSVHHGVNRQSDVPTYIHRGNALPWNNSSRGFFAWLPIADSWIGPEWDDDDLRKSFNLYTDYLNADGEITPLPDTSPILFKKFIKDPSGIALYSIPIFRYAEAFLIYAEASNRAEGSPSPLALERLNKIKRRGYGYNSNSVSPVDYPEGLSSEEFHEIVIQERGYEFILERKRWYDLKRTGTIKEAFAEIGKNYSDNRLLWPIPEDEINNNDSINEGDQNPGY